MPLPTIAGTNCMTKAEDALAASLAASTKFAAFILPHTTPSDQISIDILDDPADGSRYTLAELAALLPHCLIGHDGDETTFDLKQVAMPEQFNAAGVIGAKFMRAVNTALSAKDSLRQLKNHVGDIAEELTDFINDSAGDKLWFLQSFIGGWGLNEQDEFQSIGELEIVEWHFAYGRAEGLEQ